jgi:ribosomal protein L21
MYAIVEITGQQFKVEKDKSFTFLPAEDEGENVEFEKVLVTMKVQSVWAPCKVPK